MKSCSLMNQTVIETISSRNTGGSLARFGHSHGYLFDADTVRLNVMFTVTDAAAHSCSWALQLWGCPETLNQNQTPGHLIAQVTLPPIGEIADDKESFEVNVPASLPAGQKNHPLLLVLVAGHNGQFSEVHDAIVYPRREAFCLPRLGGNVGYSISGDRVVLSAERIENPRGTENLSGTLALELWALPTRYNGGAFNGRPLAGVAFDPLAGQCEYHNRAFDLPFVAPGAGQWNLVLMLREWTAAGYVTRDYVNFNQLFTQSEPAKAEAPAAIKAAVTPAQPTIKRAAQDKNLVSVNKASVGELAEIKGMPEKVAKGIVKERPFLTLDELVRVKGVGAKLLAKIRSRLKL